MKKQINFSYLNKGYSRIYQRKDANILKIHIENCGDKRLRISKTIDSKLLKILGRLFLENGDYIA